MARPTNRREFVQVAGLAASGLMAAVDPLSAADPEPQARPAPKTMGARFHELMNGPEPLICANAYDVLTARIQRRVCRQQRHQSGITRTAGPGGRHRI